MTVGLKCWCAFSIQWYPALFLAWDSCRSALSRPGRKRFQLSHLLTTLVIWLFRHENKPVLEPRSPFRCHTVIDTLPTSHYIPLHQATFCTQQPHPVACWLYPQHDFITASAAPRKAPSWPPQQHVLSTSAYTSGARHTRWQSWPKRPPVEDRTMPWLWQSMTSSHFLDSQLFTTFLIYWIGLTNWIALISSWSNINFDPGLGPSPTAATEKYFQFWG